MGLEILVPRRTSFPLAGILDALGQGGLPSTVAMVDNVLQGPGALVPEDWRDVRLRTPAGTVTLRRQPSGVAVIVFGNADLKLRDAQRRIAELLRDQP